MTALTDAGFFSATLSEITPVVQLSSLVSCERTITLEEVSWHDSAADCWLVIYDRVYDITDFLHQHPGGHDILLEYGGRDATIAFRGTGHSSYAIKALDNFLIGILPVSERIFRKSDGFNLTGIPI